MTMTKEKTINRIVTVLDGLLNTAVVLAALLILFASLYSIFDNLWLYKGAADTATIMSYKPDMDRPLEEQITISEEGVPLIYGRRISENQVAWIALEGTNIDYPLVQGEDNFEYLNKDPYGEFKLSGSIFLDYRNDPLLTDEYSVIYGHHMERGVMFGSLDDYRDESYFDAHRTGRIVTAKSVYDFELFAVCAADGRDQTLFNPAGRTAKDIIKTLRKNAMIFEEPEEGLPIVTLTTCSDESLMARLLVFGTIRGR